MAKYAAGGQPVYYTNAPAPNEGSVICGVNCKCQKKKKASEKLVPGYDYIKYLDSGGYGAVHLYRNRQTQETVAIKSLSFVSKKGENILHMVSTEYDIVMNISHPNITKYYNFFINPSLKKCYIVMEYASRGALRKLINCHSAKQEYVNAGVIIKIIRDIVSGVAYLNRKNVVHCDLKPENILMGNDGLMKICDFGLAHFDCDINGPVGGTTVYLAPELFERNSRPNEKTEVWAIGIILYELCNLCNPFSSLYVTTQYVERAKNLQMPPLNSCYGSDMKKLFQMMIQLRPEHRHTLSNILGSKLLRSM